MDELRDYVKAGNADKVVERVKILLEKGTDPESMMKDAMIPAMDEVGELFQKGEYYMPEMLVAAMAMQEGMDVLKPILVEKGVEPLGTVVMGTVQGDLHDIGKNLVGMALEGAGFTVTDLGVDVPPAKFIEAIREHKPVLVGLSALLSSTMITMKETVAEILESDVGDNVKIMIGGAAVTDEFAKDIGADFYGAAPASAKDFARSLLAA